MPLAVVGHVEWVEFARVDRLPAAGGIAHAADSFSEPAGGGAVAAVQLARLAGGADLFTALGDDEVGEGARRRLAELGVNVHAAGRDAPTRRALTLVDPAGERTITTIGERLAPRLEDPLPWEVLEGCDGVYFTAGDAGALRAARRAPVLVATPRAGEVLSGGEIGLDALVFSERDELESAAAASVAPPPALVAATRGENGGAFTTAGGATGEWRAAPLPGALADTYGCGDSFAAALCWSLARGEGPEDALATAAEAGAACATGRGPYEHQLAPEA